MVDLLQASAAEFCVPFKCRESTIASFLQLFIMWPLHWALTFLYTLFNHQYIRWKGFTPCIAPHISYLPVFVLDFSVAVSPGGKQQGMGGGGGDSSTSPRTPSISISLFRKGTSKVKVINISWRKAVTNHAEASMHNFTQEG